MTLSIADKRLRIGLTYSSVIDLPPQSRGWQKTVEDIYAAAANAGYEAMQGGDARLCHSFGMEFIAQGVIDKPDVIQAKVRTWKEQGAIAATCIVGYGYESDAEIDALIKNILQASHQYELPVYIETHRASVTQDAWRTAQLTRRLPDVRFNGDFSHWFTGQEMPYGNFEDRLDRLSAVFERVRFLHGRIGNRCCMQVDIGDGTTHPSIPYFQKFWTRSMQGFLGASDSGRDLWFCPELLGPEYQYAHTTSSHSNSNHEMSDRWTQSAVLVELAKRCYAEAVVALPS